MNRILYLLVFAVGLAIVGWVGVGYVASSPLALAVTAIIALVYIAGALELYRYQQATGTLERALSALSEAPADLAQWLSGLDGSLRESVRLRVEGERVGLPGPSLTPYLVGLLVLLGMLGTFLGMVATLRGTGLALENATDLQAIRASLAAPVTGLGFAFGTSVAGVGTSAMLGLLSALCRRDRTRAVRQLDTQVATTLRVYSQAHQREESFRLMQQQSQALPLVADRLQAMLTAMEEQSRTLTEKLVAGQEAFQAKNDERHLAVEQQSLALSERIVASQEALLAKNEAAYAAIDQRSLSLNERLVAGHEGLQTKTELAYSKLIESAESLHSTLAASAESMQSTLSVSVETMHSNLSTSAEALYSKLSASAEAVHSKLAASTEAAYTKLASSVDESLKQSLAEGARAASLAIQPAVEATFENLARENTALQDTIRQSVQQQLQALSSQIDESTAKVEQSMSKAANLWVEALGEHKLTSESLVNEQRRISESLIQENQRASEAMLKAQHEAGASLVTAQKEAGDALIETQQLKNDAFIQEQQNAAQSLLQSLRNSNEAFAETFEQRSTAVVDAVAARMQELSSGIAEGWDDTLSQQQRVQQKLAEDNQQALANAIAAIEQQGSALLRAMGDSSTELKAALAAQDTERLAKWTEAFAAMTAALQEEWHQTAEATAARQKEICDTLERTAGDISAQSKDHAIGTIAEIERLVQAASEAPKAAAEVVTQVRESLSQSMARDNAMLEERERMLETLSTLLDAVNHASKEQRTAVDALLSSSSDLLDRIGTQVTDKVEVEAGKLGYMASQVSGSAIEIATLGDSFGKAVAAFSESNASMMQHLQRVEESLEQSIVRSDEQLAYYVAQAREVIDLSMLSQKQILQQLQQGSGPAPAEVQRSGGAKPGKGAAKPGKGEADKGAASE